MDIGNNLIGGDLKGESGKSLRNFRTGRTRRLALEFRSGSPWELLVYSPCLFLRE
jgi:hypothetical protein